MSKKTEKKEQPSVKTDHLMRIIQPHDGENAVVVAGKSRMPKQLRGIEPLTRIIRRESKAIAELEEPETVNITALLIEDNAVELLRRFNACDCSLCVERLSQLTAEKVPTRFAKLPKADAEKRTGEYPAAAEPVKRQVTSTMIRLIITNKNRSFH